MTRLRNKIDEKNEAKAARIKATRIEAEDQDRRLKREEEDRQMNNLNVSALRTLCVAQVSF